MTLCRPCCFHCAERTLRSRVLQARRAHTLQHQPLRGRVRIPQNVHVCVHVCECVCVPVGAIEVLCFIYFEHMLSKYQASRAKGWLFQQLCDVNSSRNRFITKCATVKHSRPIGDRCTATRCTRRTCLRNKQGSSRVRRPNLRSLSNPDR